MDKYINKKHYKSDATRKFVLVVFFVFTLAIGFGIGEIRKANAETTGSCYLRPDGCPDPTISPSTGACDIDLGSNLSKTDCTTKCNDAVKTTAGKCIYNPIGAPTVTVANSSNNVDVCADVGFRPKTWINCFLLYVLQFLTGLLSVAASLFNWIISADNMKSVMANPIVYQIWALVRDALNIAFILVLLFSAFCTVFQISKYNYKNILLTLIIMALLVNFSFPIARVIIDFSNVLMYYLIKVLDFQSNGSSFFVNISKDSDLGKILYQNSTRGDTTPLIAAVIFTFILAVTLLIIAILFFIRLIVLTILIIFSSIAFIGAIVPFLSSQASKWWDALFKYAFFGPIMIFMIVVATKMMAAISPARVQIENEALRQSGMNFVSNMAFFAIPIVILWIGIGFAQQMSIAGASAVVGRGQKFMGWAGSTFSGWRAAKYGYKKGEQGAKYVAGAAWEQFDRRILRPRGISPGALWQGWKERAEEVKKRSKDVAAGRGRDFFHKLLDKQETNFEQLAVSRVKAEEMKRYKEDSEDFQVLGTEMARLTGSNMRNAPEKLASIFKIAFGNRDQDEIIHFIRNNWDKNILGNGKSFKDIFEAEGMKIEDIVVEGFAVTEVVEKLLKTTQGTKQGYINKEISDLGQIAASNGGIGFGGVKRDSTTGKLVRTKKEEQAYIAARKHQTVFEPQDMAKKEHRNWETNEIDPNIVNLGAIEKMRWASLANISQIERTHPSKVEQVGANEKLGDSFYRELESMRKGILKVWDTQADGGKGAVVEIKNSSRRDDYAHQAYISAAYRAALQMVSGVDHNVISGQLTKHGFEVKKINEILDQAKRPKLGKQTEIREETGSKIAEKEKEADIKIEGGGGGGSRPGSRVTF